MKSPNALTVLFGMCVLALVGCYSDNVAITDSQNADDSIEIELSRLEATATPMDPASQTPPSGLVTVSLGSEQLEFWPYTGTNFSGQRQDPINLIFFGEADPRDIRAALLSLDGDRSAFGFPPVAPFNSTWDDAFGDVQTAYGTDVSWTGVVVQLEAGNYQDARFHLRLFKVGQWTVGAAHFEIRIPGTTEHQVLSWELAEQFVVADFIRSGLLDDDLPMMPTSMINESPFRTIPAIIYNGLPVELKSLAGGPLSDVSEDVPIGTDGHAMILNLGQTVDRIAETRVQNFVIDFNQIIPKPFCSSGELDFVLIQGPVEFYQTSRQTENGTFTVSAKARANLVVTPVNPLTGEPVGEPLDGRVIQKHDGSLSNLKTSASSLQLQKLSPENAPGSGSLFIRLQVRSDGNDMYQARIRCSSDSNDVSSSSDSVITSLLTHSAKSD